MDIRPDELLRAIHMPRNTKGLTHYYRKVGTRKAQAISKVCFAAVAGVKDGNIDHARIALGSVAPIPIRCFKTENAVNGLPLNGQTIAAATQSLAAEISPIDDIRSTKDYRLQVSLNLLEDFLSHLK
jgi:CO/xanthine dehydrogenase FAD-binding subunit